MLQHSNISGAILAGGRNSRMGGVDKAFLEVQGRPLIHRTIKLFKEIFTEIIVVTNTPDRYRVDAAGAQKSPLAPLGQRGEGTESPLYPPLQNPPSSPLFQRGVRGDLEVKIMTDEIKGAGPLGGIYTALRGTEKEAVFFTACDMPFLHNETICRQIAYFQAKNCDALVPRVGGFIEPLHAIFKKSVAEKILYFIRGNCCKTPFSVIARAEGPKQSLSSSEIASPLTEFTLSEVEGRTSRELSRLDSRFRGNDTLSKTNVTARYSIRNFLRTIDVCYWDLEDTPFYRKMFKNINTEKDAAALCR